MCQCIEKFNNKAEIRVIEHQIDTYDSKLSNLRMRYAEINTKIIEVETGISNIKKDDVLNNYKNLEQNFKILKALKEEGLLEHNLKILKALKDEVLTEGNRLKIEKENWIQRIDQLKTVSLISDQNPKPIFKGEVIQEEVICNLGAKCLCFAEFLFPSKTCREVFNPLVGDWREDYLNALRKGRIWDAAFISLRNYFSFVYTMIICSRFGKLVEFVVKIADIIEFFNKFSK